ncbi:EG45-like domain containing protein [Primulina huaijiensis]|uniref:EG45-like domain containing protein n=1 Tax=Primulina huaijiensis TaxID=1492673 RepID=UPI003CC706B5
MATERIIILAIIIASVVSVASAVAGTATYYTVYLPSACYGYQDQGTMIAAANRDLYDNGAACGKNYRVKCTGPTNQGVPQPCRNGEIIVKIVDLCPGCGTNQLDLSEQAFSTIADPNAGKIQIEYNPA